MSISQPGLPGSGPPRVFPPVAPLQTDACVLSSLWEREDLWSSACPFCHIEGATALVHFTRVQRLPDGTAKALNDVWYYIRSSLAR